MPKRDFYTIQLISLGELQRNSKADSPRYCTLLCSYNADNLHWFSYELILSFITVWLTAGVSVSLPKNAQDFSFATVIINVPSVLKKISVSETARSDRGSPLCTMSYFPLPIDFDKKFRSPDFRWKRFLGTAIFCQKEISVRRTCLTKLLISFERVVTRIESIKLSIKSSVTSWYKKKLIST